MAQDHPRALTWVARWVLATIVVGAATAVLVVVQSDALQAAWTVGHPPDSLIKPLEFVPVAIVLYVVFAGMSLLMLAFLLGAHGWARYCLAAILFFVMFATLAGLRTDPPPAFLVVSALGLVAEAASLVFLFHPDTSAFLREPRSPSQGDPRERAMRE